MCIVPLKITNSLNAYLLYKYNKLWINEQILETASLHADTFG